MGSPVVHLLQGLGQGGLERAAVDLALALREDHPTSFVRYDEDTGGLDAVLRAAEVEVVTLRRRPRFDPSFVRELRRWLRTRPAGIVHAHNPTAAFYAALAAPRALGWRVIHTEHGPPRPDSWRARAAFRWLARPRIDRVVAVAAALRPSLRSACGYPPDRIAVLPNGVPEVPPDPHARREVRAALGSDPDVLAVLVAGRLAAGKGVMRTLDAAAQVIAVRPDVEVWIAGAGPLDAAIDARLADDPRLAARVRRLGWRADVGRLLAAADVLVHASDFEACSRILVEALAAGLPVVAHPVGGNTEVLGDAGVLVAREPAALAAAILGLCGDPARRAALAARARERHRERFRLDAVAAAWRAVYASLDPGRTSPP